MKKIFQTILIATALTLAWGCSSSDSDDEPNGSGQTVYPPTAVSEPPSWDVTFTLPQGESGKPAWQQVDFYQFENTMTIVLHLDDYMTPYLSEGDQIAAIVNNEVREIADIQFYQLTENDPKKNMFMLLVPFADSETTADLSYYNAQTNQHYLLSTVSLIDNNTLGSEYDLVLGLYEHGTLTAQLGEKVPFQPASGDKLAIFEDEICCGVGTYDAQTQKWSIPFYDLSSNTTKAHFRYYSAEKRAIYRAEVVIDVDRIRRTVQTPYLLDF